MSFNKYFISYIFNWLVSLYINSTRLVRTCNIHAKGIGRNFCTTHPTHTLHTPSNKQLLHAGCEKRGSRRVEPTPLKNTLRPAQFDTDRCAFSRHRTNHTATFCLFACMPDQRQQLRDDCICCLGYYFPPGFDYRSSPFVVLFISRAINMAAHDS